jgi:hypothetical protein
LPNVPPSVPIAWVISAGMIQVETFSPSAIFGSICRYWYDRSF